MQLPANAPLEVTCHVEEMKPDEQRSGYCGVSMCIYRTVSLISIDGVPVPQHLDIDWTADYWFWSRRGHL